MITLHPKIQALRDAVGHRPIHYFYPKRSEFEKKPIEVRSPKPKSDNERLIQQYFCIFGIPDDYGTVPVKGAFQKSLDERGPNTKANYKILALWMHDRRDPLCVPNVLKEDEVGLYGEYEPDQVPSGDRCVLQVRSGTINQGSYGFNYIWDKMEYVEDTGLILMKEIELLEVSPVSIGSQKETFVVRAPNGEFTDEFLEEETEDLIKQLPRKYHLEIRTLIDRHITLAELKPLEQKRQALGNDKPKQGLEDEVDIDYLISKF